MNKVQLFLENVDELMDISETSDSKLPVPLAHLNILGTVLDGHFGKSNTSIPKEDENDNSDFADLSTFEEDNLMTNDDGALPSYLTAEEPTEDSTTLVRTRTYDLSITYDKYYQVPRVWLFGYDEIGQPLSKEELFEDIMQDYANKTVTMELHPHETINMASIHPCQHSAVMKRIVENLGNGGKEARVEQYLFIFLKFIQSVIPTIDYDYTMEIEGKA